MAALLGLLGAAAGGYCLWALLVPVSTAYGASKVDAGDLVFRPLDSEWLLLGFLSGALVAYISVTFLHGGPPALKQLFDWRYYVRVDASFFGKRRDHD